MAVREKTYTPNPGGQAALSFPGYTGDTDFRLEDYRTPNSRWSLPFMSIIGNDKTLGDVRSCVRHLLDIPAGATILKAKLRINPAQTDASTPSFSFGLGAKNESWDAVDDLVTQKFGLASRNYTFRMEAREPSSTVLAESGRPGDVHQPVTGDQFDWSCPAFTAGSANQMYQFLTVNKNTGAGTRTLQKVDFTLSIGVLSVFNPGQRSMVVELWSTRTRVGSYATLPDARSIIPDSLIATSTAMDLNALTGSFTVKTFDFPTSPSVTDGVTYALVIRHTIPYAIPQKNTILIRGRILPVTATSPLVTDLESVGGAHIKGAGFGGMSIFPDLMPTATNVPVFNQGQLFQAPNVGVNGLMGPYVMPAFTTDVAQEWGEGYGGLALTLTGLVQLLQDWIDDAGYVAGAQPTCFTLTPNSPSAGLTKNIDTQNSNRNGAGGAEGIELTVEYDDPNLTDVVPAELTTDAPPLTVVLSALDDTQWCMEITAKPAIVLGSTKVRTAVEFDGIGSDIFKASESGVLALELTVASGFELDPVTAGPSISFDEISVSDRGQC